jgi:hypothetical protein
MASPKLALWVLWSLVIVVFVLTSGLWWLNRASDKVQVTLPTAVLAGFGAILVTLVFSLKSETVKEQFPTDFVVDPISKQPFSCGFFPDMLRYTDPGFGVGIAPMLKIMPKLLQEAPHLEAATDNQTLEQLYRNVREQGDAGDYAAAGISSTSMSMSGYQRLKMTPNSPSSVLTRVCSNKCAPGLDHCICCFLQNRLLTT